MENGAKAELSLTVRDPLTSLTLDKPQTTLLYGGATTTVTASTTPSDYDANNLTWTIGDTSLATISGTGKTRTITSNNTKKTGETTLTVSCGGKTATMKISIVNFTTTTYSYTGSVQQIDLPAGTYKLEVWGAQGGSNDASFPGGLGGYSFGTINITTHTKLFIYVGGTGTHGNGTINGGFNGGGAGNASNSYIAGSGGGATDIRIKDDSLYSRVIVAGGGGGGSNTAGGGNSTNGGYGGGTSGGLATPSNHTGCSSSNAATQNTGGTNSVSGSGAFGIGGNAKGSNIDYGGGSGWYGGAAGYHRGGGGGSGYVYTSSTASNYPSGCLLNSSYYLTNAQTIAGNQSFPNVAGTGNETGHSGNGAAKITPVN